MNPRASREIDKYITCVLRCSTPINDYSYQMRIYQKFRGVVVGEPSWWNLTAIPIHVKLRQITQPISDELQQDTNV